MGTGVVRRASTVQLRLGVGVDCSREFRLAPVALLRSAVRMPTSVA